MHADIYTILTEIKVEMNLPATVEMKSNVCD